ncbi:hypothetical protein D6745_01055 [Candidatus Woesearchaeota archaeon]|nr:MAG: hypothetical protein D6745_01055 [Candidatus Woesearchaeota archaeon]
MAKILYSLNGEGMGHAIRSQAIIEKLLRHRHNIIITAGGKAYKYLHGRFNDVFEIEPFHISYKDNTVNRLGTFFEFFRHFRKKVRSARRIIRIIKRFRPDVIISDFDIYSVFLKPVCRVPIISIDNQSIITNAKISFPRKHWLDYIISWLLVKSATSAADYHLITSFFQAEIKKKNTYLFPPVIRKKILDAKPTSRGHVLVYQTSWTDKKLFEVLKKVPENFVVYGYKKTGKDNNLTFRNFDERNFVKDLASCKAVITNGGFTLITEALYLRKPVLSVPVKKQFEQILNAHYLDKTGIGKFCEEISVSAVKSFLKSLRKYKKKLEQRHSWDNHKIIARINLIIKKHEKQA